MISSYNEPRRRLPGWESRLNDLIDECRRTPYVLGEFDCFRVACKTVELLTGIDRWSEWAGRYTTKRGAMKLLAEHGSNFEEAGDWFFGADNRQSPRWARVGDIVELQTPDGEKHLGVCLGVNSMFLTDKGVGYVPTLKCPWSWRVG